MPDEPLPKIHSSITQDRVRQALEAYQRNLDNPGFCLACGADADGCEPDARGYHCESCGANAVMGAEEVALIMFI